MWFVSKRAYDLVLKDRDEARAELTRLQNEFIWRATGIASRPDLLPEEYRTKPKSEPKADRGAVLNDAKEPAAPFLSPRQKLRQVEEERERKYDEENKKMHIVEPESKEA